MKPADEPLGARASGVLVTVPLVVAHALGSASLSTGLRSLAEPVAAAAAAALWRLLLVHVHACTARVGPVHARGAGRPPSSALVDSCSAVRKQTLYDSNGQGRDDQSPTPRGDL